VEGISKTANIKPQNLLAAYMGCDKWEMVELVMTLSNDDE